MLVVVIVLIWNVFFGDLYFGRGFKDTVSPHARELMLALQLPFVLALVGLVRGPFRFALGLAATAAFTLLVPVVPFGVTSFFFAGFTDGTPDLWTPCAMVALIPALGLLAGSALVGLLRRGGPVAGAVGLGFVISIACGIVIVVLAVVLEARDRRRWETVARNNGDAELHAAEIARCAKAYAHQDPIAGFPANLAAIGPQGTGCLSDAEIDTRRGFHFTYLSSPPDERGHRVSFSICGQPLHYRESGTETVVLDSADPHLQKMGQSSEATTPISCGARWYGYEGLGSALHFCLLSYAREHPDRGFPRTLTEVQACVTSTGLGGRWLYRPAAPNAEGVVVRYEANWQEGYGSRWSGFTDETAVLRVADDHTATASDPTYEEFMRRRTRAAPSASPSTPSR